eukprot:gnl/MRDRNA2_/MRDRNA2_123510_c0_seq1.p1 gnl/MRDRNA2_/MRDRNA2_123510_c0~~gnl/MRDRNA2_/MRDRNA2_123510_c0_seq1.p1  ORF type:complete len:599 (+),score=150.04 gnl/MRDRNA2_/MRDRNA2_123510_c0_seq1:133-1929(+)
MRNAWVLIPISFIAQAYATNLVWNQTSNTRDSIDKSVDHLVNELLCSALRVLAPSHTHWEQSMLFKIPQGRRSSSGSFFPDSSSSLHFSSRGLHVPRSPFSIPNFLAASKANPERSSKYKTVKGSARRPRSLVYTTKEMEQSDAPTLKRTIKGKGRGKVKRRRRPLDAAGSGRDAATDSAAKLELKRAISDEIKIEKQIEFKKRIRMTSAKGKGREATMPTKSVDGSKQKEQPKAQPTVYLRTLEKLMEELAVTSAVAQIRAAGARIQSASVAAACARAQFEAVRAEEAVMLQSSEIDQAVANARAANAAAGFGMAATRAEVAAAVEAKEQFEAVAAKIKQAASAAAAPAANAETRIQAAATAALPEGEVEAVDSVPAIERVQAAAEAAEAAKAITKKQATMTATSVALANARAKLLPQLDTDRDTTRFKRAAFIAAQTADQENVVAFQAAESFRQSAKQIQEARVALALAEAVAALQGKEESHAHKTSKTANAVALRIQDARYKLPEAIARISVIVETGQTAIRASNRWREAAAKAENAAEQAQVRSKRIALAEAAQESKEEDDEEAEEEQEEQEEQEEPEEQEAQEERILQSWPSP